MKIRNTIFYTKDIKKAKEFYTKLGLKLIDDFGHFVSYDSGVEGVLFSINVTDNPTKVPGKQTCIFWTDNIEKDFRRIKNLNVEFVRELYEAPFGKTFSFRDLDGNKIELVEEN